MINIAHRGASGAYPENTLLAFRKALEFGAGWIELDVHLSADGELVVIHDEQLERTTDGRGAVRARALSELRRFDAGRGERIPLLREVLELVAGRAVLNVELKGRGSAEPTARLLSEWLEQGRLTAADLLVSAGDRQQLAVFRSLRSDLRLAVIYDRKPEHWWRLAEELQLWSLHIDRSLVTGELVEEAHRRGLRLLVFTVNDRSELLRLRQLGVDGVFTDYPERAAAFR
jgi:glycerophosphoryl diester phosphodiesterase